MKTIELSQQLYSQMPVYPGDPEVIIKEIHTLENEGWRLKSLSFSSHIGTHVNVPAHMVETGANLDDYPVDAFIAQSVLYFAGITINQDQGVIFVDQNITMELAKQIAIQKPKFIGLSADLEFDLEVEKFLLEQGIISFENLINVDQLPQGEAFEFFGIPLRIKESDGSPVRAFARIH